MLSKIEKCASTSRITASSRVSDCEIFLEIFCFIKVIYAAKVRFLITQVNIRIIFDVIENREVRKYFENHCEFTSQ